GLAVTIDGLKIMHGRAVGPGGGIQNTGSTLTLANDEFSDNVALGSNAGEMPDGGAVANFHVGSLGSLTVTDSTFVRNRADARVKNGHYAQGGAIFANFGWPSATVLRCTFLGNQALGSDGGVLATGHFSVGAAAGGALRTEGASTLTVIDSTFVGNQALG